MRLEEEVDLLFIDTWHVYGHLKRELAAHQARVRRCAGGSPVKGGCGLGAQGEAAAPGGALAGVVLCRVRGAVHCQRPAPWLNALAVAGGKPHTGVLAAASLAVLLACLAQRHSAWQVHHHARHGGGRGARGEHTDGVGCGGAGEGRRQAGRKGRGADINTRLALI